jgi:hypothetical protein
MTLADITKEEERIVKALRRATPTSDEYARGLQLLDEWAKRRRVCLTNTFLALGMMSMCLGLLVGISYVGAQALMFIFS